MGAHISFVVNTFLVVADGTTAASIYTAASTECSATFLDVCVTPMGAQNAGPTAKIEGITNSTQAADALLACLQGMTASLSTASAKLGASVLEVLVAPSLTEAIVMPLEIEPEAPAEGGASPGVIVVVILAFFAVPGALAGYPYLKHLQAKRMTGRDVNLGVEKNKFASPAAAVTSAHAVA